MKRKIVYLANPYGFSQQQKTLLLPPIMRALAYRVAQADLQDVKNCDGIFAIVNGTPPDEGVMVELGAAIALNKAIFLFRDDFRHCSDSDRYPLNLMIFAGLPEVGWEDYYYTSVDEIQSRDKAWYKWLMEM